MKLLDDWAAKATKAEKTAVYQALFAVSDGSVYQAYEIFDDMSRPREFFIVLKDDLAMKICVHHFDAFGIVYIGEFRDEDLDVTFKRAA